MNTITLSNGVKMPALGLGVFQTPPRRPETLCAPARTQKLSKALKACEKKPKKQRPSCKRQAETKYAATSKHRP